MKSRTLPILGIIAALLFQSLEAAHAAKAPPPPPLPAVLAPYLQNPTDDGLTICFPAQGAEKVHVSWSVGDSSPRQEIAAIGTPVAGTPWTFWRARLAKLTPGAAGQYQVRYQLPAGEAATPLYRFCTLNARAPTLRLAAFNDLHNNSATLEALMSHVKPEDYELTLLLGDCWADPSAANGADKVFRTLQAYVKLLNASEKPMLLIRGNHETRGNFSGLLANLFDLPNLDAKQKPDDQQWQFALRAGPMWLLAMDTGEDDNFETAENSYKRPKFWQAFRQNEAQWLQKLMATQPAGDATWRVFTSHIPLYNDNWHFCEPALRSWESLLPGINPDLMLAGHDHGWKLLPKGSSYPLKRKKGSGEETRTVTPPWPVMIGGGPALNQGTVMLLAADRRQLHVRMLAAQDGKLLTEFKTERDQPHAPSK